MKKLVFLFMMMFLIGSCDAVLAAGSFEMAGPDRFPIQAIVPQPNLSRCNTVVVTKGIFYNLSTANAGKSYFGVSWQVFDATNTFVLVKRYLGDYGAISDPYILSSGKDEAVRKDVYKFRFGATSSASRALTICSERHP